MKKTVSRNTFFAGLLITLITSTAAFASQPFTNHYDELNDDQKRSVNNGEQVMVLEDVPGYTWPKSTIYQYIDAEPEHGAAVFFGFERHVEFVPNLLKSKIAKRISPVQYQVDYTLDLPWPISNEDYTVEDTLNVYDNGQSYSLDWKLVRADATQEIIGWVHFEKLGNGTLMTYHNFIVPGSSFASWVRESAIEQVKDTANAMMTRVEWERKEKQQLLQKQVERLRNALSAHAYWQWLAELYPETEGDLP